LKELTVIPTNFPPASTSGSQLKRSFSLSVIIPTLNEAQNIGEVLIGIDKFRHCYDELIVVDGGSDDATVEVCLNYVPSIFRQTGKGKGDAIKLGVQQSTSDYILIMDADGSHCPDEIQHFVQAISRGADVVKGSRFFDRVATYDMSLFRRLGNQFFLWLANILFGTTFTDLCYGYLACRTELFHNLQIRETGFAIDTEIFLKSTKQGARIVEIPSIEFARKSGKSNLHVITDGFRILYVILREALNWSL
jgi:glycosyltransferase involved in cell wall biosynthesis